MAREGTFPTTSLVPANFLRARYPGFILSPAGCEASWREIPLGGLEQRTWSGRLVTWGWFAVIISLYSGYPYRQEFFSWL